MTFNPATSSDVMLNEIVDANLYEKILVQINKDFGLANEAIDFPASTKPNELVIQLVEKIHRLIHDKFAEYLNLLYIIDVSEKDIKSLDGSDLVILAQQVSYLILRREYQKVWFRNNYDQK